MSRFVYCNCPAGFGAGAERHAPDCPGRRLDKIAPTPVPETVDRYGCTCSCFAGASGHSVGCPMFAPGIEPKHFGASRPMVYSPGYIRPSTLPKWDCPKAPADFQPGDPYSDMRAVVLEKAAEARHKLEEWESKVLTAIFGMTSEELLANRERITRHAHPDKVVYFLDGEPVVEIHRPRFNHDEIVATFRVLRTPK